ncbi:MAG: FecR domain-containing protein, partial [Synergistaceae bacterium]|nr:FecR domain-containing protein [Synergistaceae bacterium]
VFTNDRKRFNVGVMHGAARIITGVIVKQNPNGFKVTTPKSTIGIRGTIITISVSERVETVTVNELSEGSRVTHNNRETGETKTMTMPGDTVSITTSTVDNPVTGVISTTTTTETSGAGVIDGDRDNAGFDKSGGGDNPHARESSSNESRGSGGGGEGGHGNHHNHGNGTSQGGGGCGGGNSAPGRGGALNASC